MFPSEETGAGPCGVWVKEARRKEKVRPSPPTTKMPSKTAQEKRQNFPGQKKKKEKKRRPLAKKDIKRTRNENCFWK